LIPGAPVFEIGIIINLSSCVVDSGLPVSENVVFEPSGVMVATPDVKVTLISRCVLHCYASYTIKIIPISHSDIIKIHSILCISGTRCARIVNYRMYVRGT